MLLKKNLLKSIPVSYTHLSAILDKDFNVISAVNDRNDYTGPGTGYQISAERWAELSNIENAVDASKIK